MMEDRFIPVGDIANAFIDDILNGTRVENQENLYLQHDKDLRQTLNVLKEETLVCDKRKCKLFVKEVEFCGHILGNGARKPSLVKLMAI